MNKLSRVIVFSIFGLSGSVFAAEDDSNRNRALTNLDADGDGNVNFEEFQSRGAERLSQLDQNDDGLLSLEEFLSQAPGPRRGNRNGEREPSEEQIARMEERRAAMMARATERFQTMDTDGDAHVSLAEFQESNFLALDSDNNGLLSAQELRPKRGDRRGHPGQRRGRPPQA